jgi:tetraacyldisaccharide 4'-kinase
MLARDIDLLIVSKSDLNERVLPAGRLREPLDAARHAHAVLIPGGEADVSVVAERLGRTNAFGLESHYGDLPAGVRRVVAVAGIARPQRFFDALRARGYEVLREMAFRDHHWFSARDLEAAERAAAVVGADAIVTTEKDATRIDAGGRTIVWISLPMTITIEPERSFVDWLMARLREAQAQRGAAA